MHRNVLVSHHFRFLHKPTCGKVKRLMGRAVLLPRWSMPPFARTSVNTAASDSPTRDRSGMCVCWGVARNGIRQSCCVGKPLRYFAITIHWCDLVTVHSLVGKLIGFGTFEMAVRCPRHKAICVK
jgi:hypothetical protein